LAAVGRASYVSAGDSEVLEAVKVLARSEGIIPALEPAHAVAWVARAAASGDLPRDSTVLITMSGRGDKDAEQVMDLLG
jgi:tryptophan synthase beta chain